MPADSSFTLTDLAYYGRLSVKFTIFALVTLIVGRTFFNAFSAYWVATHPPAPPPPTEGFNRLPPLNFPVQTADQKPTSYQLQTATGVLPTFGDRAEVFLMPRSAPSLLADQQAKQIASQFGFVFPPTPLDDRTYRWTKSQSLQSTLELDIQNDTFTLTTNYLSIPTLFSNNNLPAGADAANTIKSFIGEGIPLAPDIATSSGTVTYLKASGNTVVPAVSFSDANFLQVDIMRNPVDGVYQAFTSDGKGVISGIIAGSAGGIGAGSVGGDQNSPIVHLEYKYHPIDYLHVETYPLRTAAEAWQVLQAGQGYIANKGTGVAAGGGSAPSGVAVVRDVQLGYYDDFSEQDYYQPIYVFTGDGGFLGYVPAVAPQDILPSGVAAASGAVGPVGVANGTTQ